MVIDIEILKQATKGRFFSNCENVYKIINNKIYNISQKKFEDIDIFNNDVLKINNIIYDYKGYVLKDIVKVSEKINNHYKNSVKITNYEVRKLWR